MVQFLSRDVEECRHDGQDLEDVVAVQAACPA